MKIRVSAILQIISGASSLMGLRAALENSRYRFESSSAQMRETFTVKRAIIMALYWTPAKQAFRFFIQRKYSWLFLPQVKVLYFHLFARKPLISGKLAKSLDYISESG